MDNVTPMGCPVNHSILARTPNPIFIIPLWHTKLFPCNLKHLVCSITLRYEGWWCATQRHIACDDGNWTWTLAQILCSFKQRLQDTHTPLYRKCKFFDRPVSHIICKTRNITLIKITSPIVQSHLNRKMNSSYLGTLTNIRTQTLHSYDSSCLALCPKKAKAITCLDITYFCLNHIYMIKMRVCRHSLTAAVHIA